jgi:hypothetical protein
MRDPNYPAIADPTNNTVMDYCCFCSIPGGSTESGAGKSCGSSTWGETHIRTLAGIQYDFQAVGEFVLTTDDGPLQIQVRQEPYKEVFSVNTAVAMKVGSHHVSFYLRKSPHLHIDGSPYADGTVTLDNGAVVTSRVDHGSVVPANGAALDLSFDPLGYMDIAVIWNDTDYTNLKGLLGTPKPYLVTSYGNHVPLPNPPWQELYGIFAYSWRVSPPSDGALYGSMFDYERGESTATFTDYNYPERTFYAGDLDMEEHAKAEAVCKAAGVHNPDLLEDCILDVAAFGYGDAPAKIYASLTPPRLVVHAVGSAPGRPCPQPTSLRTGTDRSRKMLAATLCVAVVVCLILIALVARRRRNHTRV